VLELKNTFTFFSDHNLIPLHPAQMAHPRSVEMLRALANDVGSPGDLAASEPGVGERIYISRDDAALRRVANEAEISAIAREAGFASIRMSDYSLTGQIAVMRGARYVIGPHGMGLTHMIFNRGPLGILELFHPTLGTDAYAMMSRALGFDYHWMVGEAIDDHKASYRIDPNEFAGRLLDLDW
jgi:capsular polysaccharide biosynthesis protein